MSRNDQKNSPADGWRLGPSTETPGGRVHVFGMNEDEMLSRLYTHLADWLHVVKKIVKKEKLDLSHYLEECLGKACRDRNVPDSSERTAGKLLPHGRDLPPGPDLLLFFFKKCPHSRDAFLRGKLPPYPWRPSPESTSTGAQAGQGAAEGDTEGENVADTAGVTSASKNAPKQKQTALESLETAKRLAEFYGLDVRRVRMALKRALSQNPFLRTSIEEPKARSARYLYDVKRAVPILEKLREYTS